MTLPEATPTPALQRGLSQPAPPPAWPRLTVRLPLWAEHLDIHGRVESTKDLLPLVSSPLVTGVDGAGLPVCPVQSVSRERQGKRVRQTALHDLLPVGGRGGGWRSRQGVPVVLPILKAFHCHC